VHMFAYCKGELFYEDRLWLAQQANKLNLGTFTDRLIPV
jgi:hypothetical protein